jgi:exodeoxyribonuclease-3
MSNAYGRNADLHLDHLLLSPLVAGRLIVAGVDTHMRGWKSKVTMHQHGSSF